MTTLAPPVSLRDLGELAGQLAIHSQTVRSGDVPDAELLYNYSALSRRRLKLWWDAIAHCDSAEGDAARRTPLAHLTDEILVAEILTRVAAALLAVNDQFHAHPRAAAFGRHALLDQLQAKQAVLNGALNGSPPLGMLLRINQLRRRTERWADFLLGTLFDSELASEFAVEPQRARDFHEQRESVVQHGVRPLLLIGLRASLPHTLVEDPLRARTQAAIMRLLFSLLPQSAFGWDGRLRGPLLQRIAAATTDVTPASRPGAEPMAAAGFSVVRRRVRRIDVTDEGSR